MARNFNCICDYCGAAIWMSKCGGDWKPFDVGGPHRCLRQGTGRRRRTHFVASPRTTCVPQIFHGCGPLESGHSADNPAEPGLAYGCMLLLLLITGAGIYCMNVVFGFFDWLL